MLAFLFGNQVSEAPDANLGHTFDSSAVPVPDMPASAIQEQVASLSMDIVFPWEYSTAQSHALGGMANAMQFFAKDPSSASFMANVAMHGPQAMPPYAMMPMTQPAPFQLWVQQHGLYSSLPFAGMGAASAPTPSQVDFASSFVQFMPPLQMSMPSTADHPEFWQQHMASQAAAMNPAPSVHASIPRPSPHALCSQLRTH